MSAVVDIRRELEHIERKGARFVEETIGEAIVWWEYDAVNSAYDHVYDEPSMTEKRVWKPAIIVPVQWISITQGDRRMETQGRMVTDYLRFGISIRRLRDVGLSDPSDHRRHLNDLILYRRRLWAISVYAFRGRIRDYVNVDVAATEIHEDDMPFDTLPTFDSIAFVDRPKGFPSSEFEDQSFPEHELPAYQYDAFPEEDVFPDDDEFPDEDGIG